MASQVVSAAEQRPLKFRDMTSVLGLALIAALGFGLFGFFLVWYLGIYFSRWYNRTRRRSA